MVDVVAPAVGVVGAPEYGVVVEAGAVARTDGSERDRGIPAAAVEATGAVEGAEGAGGAEVDEGVGDLKKGR